MAADALDRRKLMLLTQSTMAVLAAILFAVTYHGLAVVWPIYVLAAASSAAGAFDLPARQSMVPSLVPREHLPNAISLNTSMVQVASVAGPALGGVIIATAGVAWAYAFNALSYLVVIAALLMMRVDERREADGRGPLAGPPRRRSDFSIACGARRPALRVPLAAHPLDDAAGFLRDVLFVGDGAAADLRAGRAARRRARVRLALFRAGGRRRAWPARSWSARSI